MGWVWRQVTYRAPFLVMLRVHSDGHMRTELEVSLFCFSTVTAYVLVSDKNGSLQTCGATTSRTGSHEAYWANAEAFRWVRYLGTTNVQKLDANVLDIRSATTERRIRIERHKTTMSYTDAFDFVSQFYTQKTQCRKASTNFTSGLYFVLIMIWVLTNHRQINGWGGWFSETSYCRSRAMHWILVCLSHCWCLTGNKFLRQVYDEGAHASQRKHPH